MSIYHGKLLELKGIERKSNKHFIQARLSFKQDIDMFWEIDEYTAENLKSLIQFDGKHKYRLSFNNSWDSMKNQYIGILTRTYREKSDLLYFSCSEDYINKLNIIKNCQHTNDLDKLIFEYTDLTLIDNQYKEKQNEEKIPKKYIHKFTRTSVAIICIVFSIFFSYLIRPYLNKTTFDEKVLAQSIQLDNDVTIKQREILESMDNIIIEDFSPNEPTIPYIELEQSMTYNISEGTVALTFDDGPSQYSMEIMDILKKYGVGGTFFFTGYNIKKYPDYVQYIGSNGYSIGSHSMNHINMPTLSYEKQKNEIVESIKLLEEITNKEVTLFRPPYGSLNQQIKNIAYEHEYKIVLWNNDPEDWKNRDADNIFASIKNSDVSGSIILLHESQAVIDALPKIIEYLQGLNLEIINLQ